MNVISASFLLTSVSDENFSARDVRGGVLICLLVIVAIFYLDFFRWYRSLPEKRSPDDPPQRRRITTYKL